MGNVMEKTILFLHRDPIQRKTFDKYFGDRYQLLLAETTEEGLKYLEEQEIPVVILGRWGDGFEFFKEVRQKFPASIRGLVGCDCFRCKELAKKGLEEGIAERYIPWPLNEHEKELLEYFENAFKEYRVRKGRLLSESSEGSA